MKELVFDLQRFADKITYDDEVLSFLKVLADLDKKLGLTKLADFLEADEKGDKNIEGVSSTIKFFGALYKTINKDTSLNDGAVLISTIIDIVKESVQISVDVDEGQKSANDIKESVMRLVSKYTIALDKLTKLTDHKTSFLLIGAAAIALSANFITSLDISTDEEARKQLFSLLKDEVNVAKEAVNTCMKKFFSDDLAASLFNGKIVDNDITAPLGSIALASSAFTGIISGVMTFFDEVEHYKEDGIPEDIAIKDAIITAVADAIKETASKYTKGFDDVAFKALQDIVSVVTQKKVNTIFADKNYMELIVENLKTFNYKNTGTAGDNRLISSENDEMVYGYDGNDYITNSASNVKIFGGHDKDTIFSHKGYEADSSTPQSNSILGGPGNDSLIAYDINSTIYGGKGDDKIAIYGTKNEVFGEDDKDVILFGDGADNNTASGGLSDDIIILASVKNAVIEYTEGDGNDNIFGYDESDVIKITGKYSTQTSGENVIIGVGAGSITLNDAVGKTININGKRSVIGESTERSTTTFTSLPSIWNDGVKIIRGTKGDDTFSISESGNYIDGVTGKDQYIFTAEAKDNTLKTFNVSRDKLQFAASEISAEKKIDNDGNESITICSGQDTLLVINSTDGTKAVNDNIFYDNGKKQTTLEKLLLVPAPVFPDKNTGGTKTNRTFSVSGSKNTIYGTDGDDTFSVNGERNTIYGGKGDDAFSVTFSYSFDFFGSANDFYGDEGNDSFDVTGHYNKIDGGDGDDTFSVGGRYHSIYGGEGDDSFSVRGDNVLIDGGDGDDSIHNTYGDSVTIDGGVGDDLIYNDQGSNVSITGGDGDDIFSVDGGRNTIDGSEGNDIFSVQYGFNTIYSGEGNDIFSISGGSNKINGGKGDDIFYVSYDSYSSINGGEGDETFSISGGSNTIDGGAGNDTFSISGGSNTIDGGAGNDTFSISRGSNSINGGEGNDIFSISGGSNTIDGGKGNDTFSISRGSNSINGGEGNDIFSISGGSNKINGGKGDDIFYVSYDSYSSINGGEGDDIFYVSGNHNDMYRSAGNETFSVSGSNNYIFGGSYIYGDSGKDQFVFTAEAKNNTLKTFNVSNDKIQFAASEISAKKKNDNKGHVLIIICSGKDTLLFINNTEGTTSVNDNIFYDNGKKQTTLEKLLLAPASPNNATTKGGSSSTSTTTDGGSSSTIKSGSSSTSTTTGGGSSSTTKNNNSSSTSTGGGSSSTTKNNNSSSTSTGGGSSSTIKNNNSSSTSTGGGSSSTTKNNNSSSTSTTDNNQVVYTGGDKTISNYSGQAVTLGAYTGANFNGNNFVVNSPTGALVIESVTDKIVDLRDGAGNAFIKAYTPSTAGIIDGRGIDGYEIIQGAANGTDVILAGDDGSQLWGGSGFDADAIAGGNGSDIFIGGRLQGADNFYNVSSADAVNLTDASLSDIVGTFEFNGTIAIGFNTGSAIMIQSTDMLSGAINLADGSSWRYNHATKSWQGA